MVRCFQDQGFAGTDGSESGGNAGAQAFTVYENAVGCHLFVSDAINDLRPIVEFLLGEFSAAFAIARVIDHQHAVAGPGHGRSLVGIISNMLAVAVKIKDDASKGLRRIGQELDQVERVACVYGY